MLGADGANVGCANIVTWIMWVDAATARPVSLPDAICHRDTADPDLPAQIQPFVHVPGIAKDVGEKVVPFGNDVARRAGGAGDGDDRFDARECCK